MKRQGIFSGKNKVKIELSFAESAQGVEMVRILSLILKIG